MMMPRDPFTFLFYFGIAIGLSVALVVGALVWWAV